MPGIRRLAFISTSLVGALAFLPQMAAAADKATDATDVQEVVVTGSRIARPNLDQPTPVSSISLQQIENAGTANLGDIIALLPEVGTGYTVRANSNNYGSLVAPGISAVDLHNLGPSRTLVLVDGQRHVAGDIGSNAVDINSIPTALVERAEVVTGGASAIYGSDAVSGVLNIILKKNFEGIDAQAQVGSFDGYGTKSSASFTAGKNFQDGRGNITISAFYNKEDAIRANQIPNDHNYGAITNPADLSGPLDPTFYSSPAAITKDGKPDNLTVPNVGSEYIARTGVLVGSNLIGFTPNGTPVNQPARLGYNSFLFGQLPANCTTCYFPETYTQVSSPVKTQGFNIRARYDFTPHLHGSIDAKVVESEAQNLIQPDYVAFNATANGVPFNLAPDNAFITPAIAAAIGGAQNISNYSYLGFVNDYRLGLYDRKTYRIVAKLDGDFDVKIANVKWDGALNYGQTASHTDNFGSLTTGNFAAAVDSVIDPATGKAACRVNVPSAQGAGYTAPTTTNNAACVPFNLFGSQNSAAAYAYSFANYLVRDYLSQEDANLNFTADSSRFFTLQGGPISIAAGGEYRQERTYEKNDPFILSGATDSIVVNSAGGFNVYEYYGEVGIPVFKHKGLGLDELSFDVAYRGGNYSTVGGVGASKWSFVYGPTTWMKFRGTTALAVRAPNITEAFSPVSPSYFNVTDPCDATNITGNVNYAKNCAAAGVPAGFRSNLNASIVGQTSGNPKLDPEKSLSYTGGVVVQPPMVPHLSLTVDYYSILIKNAITQVAAQDIINNCYNNSAGLNPQYCSLFTRSSSTGNINFVETTYVNAAKEYTSGVEFQANYYTDVPALLPLPGDFKSSGGRFTFTLDANYVIELRNYPFQTNLTQFHVQEGAITGAAGDVPALRALFNTAYRQGPLELSWQVRYLGRADRYSRDATQADGSESNNYPVAEAKFLHNIAARYNFGGKLEGFQVFGGINDLFGDLPPLGLVQGSNADAGYDLGRYFFAGIRYRH